MHHKLAEGILLGEEPQGLGCEGVVLAVSPEAGGIVFCRYIFAFFFFFFRSFFGGAGLLAVLNDSSDRRRSGETELSLLTPRGAFDLGVSELLIGGSSA